jgi:hypothetical protein
MQRAARLLALFLLLLPVLGSLADAQFLGGQPSHGHLYVGEVAPDHAHPYDGHEHEPRQAARGGSSAGGDANSGEVVFTPSAEQNVGPSLTTMLAAGATAMLPPPAGGSLCVGGVCDDSGPAVAHVAALTPPPRA